MTAILILFGLYVINTFFVLAVLMGAREEGKEEKLKNALTITVLMPIIIILGVISSIKERASK